MATTVDKKYLQHVTKMQDARCCLKQNQFLPQRNTYRQTLIRHLLCARYHVEQFPVPLFIYHHPQCDPKWTSLSSMFQCNRHKNIMHSLIQLYTKDKIIKQVLLGQMIYWQTALQKGCFLPQTMLWMLLFTCILDSPCTIFFVQS